MILFGLVKASEAAADELEQAATRLAASSHVIHFLVQRLVLVFQGVFQHRPQAFGRDVCA